MVKYRYIVQIKCTEAVLSNSTWKLLWFETTKMLIAILKRKRTISDQQDVDVLCVLFYVSGSTLLTVYLYFVNVLPGCV